jgi:hypothetical protein
MTKKTQNKIKLSAEPNYLAHYNCELKVTNYIDDLTNDALVEIRILHEKGNTMAVYFTPAEVRMLIQGLIDCANHGDAHDATH